GKRENGKPPENGGRTGGMAGGRPLPVKPIGTDNPGKPRKLNGLVLATIWPSTCCMAAPPPTSVSAAVGTGRLRTGTCSTSHFEKAPRNNSSSSLARARSASP